jgi:hypothetical protein
MENSVKKRSLVAASLVILWVAAAANGQVPAKPSGGEAASPEGEIQGIESEADKIIKEHPGTQKAQAMTQAAKKAASDTLAGKSPAEKAAYVGNVYFGFRSANVRARSDICAEQGVGISSFVTAFERSNEKETSRARTLWAAGGIEEDGTYAALEPQLRKTIEMDMQEFLRTRNLPSMKEACEFFAAHGAQIGSKLLFSKAMPEADEALMAPQ